MRKIAFWALTCLLHLVNTTELSSQTITVTKCVNSTFSTEGTPLAGTSIPEQINMVAGVDYPMGWIICDMTVSVVWSKTQGTCAAPTAGAVNLSEVGFGVSFSGNGVTRYVAANAAISGLIGTTASWSGSGQVLNQTTSFNDAGLSLLPASAPASGTFAPNNQSLIGAGGWAGVNPGGQWSLRALDDATTGTGRLCVHQFCITFTIIDQLAEIGLSGNGNPITDGSTTPSLSNHTDFGSQSVCVGNQTRTFTISNTGPQVLSLSLPTITGPNASDFTLSANPALTVNSGGTTTFQITFDPSAVGNRTATVTIVSNDCNEENYDFVIQGQGSGPQLTPLSQTNVACNGGNTGAAAVNAATGGTGPYTYNWTPGNPIGDGTTSVTGLTAGSWTCTVTDANSCTATQTFNITQPSAISVTPASQTNVACFGGSNGAASINTPTGGAGGYTYNWTPGNPAGDGTVSVTGLVAGTWTCTVTDANSCTATQTFNITQPSTIVLNALSQTNISCNGGSNGAASVLPASGGAGGFTYNWTPGNPAGDGTTSVTGLTAGTWTCTVTDANSCTATQTFNITQPSAIVLTAASQTNISCNGGNNGAASVNAATGGAGGYTYNWTPGNPTGDGTTSVTGLTAGTWTCTVTDANACTASQTFNITQPTPLVVNANAQTNVSCFGGSNGAASVSVSGGVAAYSYNWTPGNPTGDGTASVSGLTAGTWTCTVTDANGCTSTRTFNITQPNALVATTSSQTNVSCFGGSNGAAAINVTGGVTSYSYNWTPGNPTGDGTASVSGLTAGTWTCTVTDANGCSTLHTVSITQPPVLAATSNVNTVDCFGGNDGSIEVFPTGGVGGYTYSWAPLTNTTSLLANIGAGTYTCIITDANGCSLTNTFNLTQPPALAATSSSTNVACFNGSTGSATVAVTGGTGPYGYSWAPTGGTNSTATGLTAGTYTCTVTDANGCTLTRTVSITQPPAITLSPSQVNTTCFGGNDGSATVAATGGTGTYTYSWAPVSGTTATLNNLASGPYTVTVTDGNGCVATQAFFIAQPVAPPIVANASANPICVGGTLTLFGTGGVTYTWNNSVVNNVPFTITATTTYIVTGTDANGCSLNDTITINVNPLPTLSATAADGAICPGASDVLTASGASTYTWSSGGTAATETVTPVTTSTYTVTGTDVNGCVNTTTVQVVVNALPNVVATAAASSVCIGDTTTLSATGADTYVWQPMNTTGSSVAVAPSVTSTYVVEGTDLEGCVNTDTITINVNALPVVNLGNDTTVCGSIVLDAGNAGATYLWNDNSTSSTLLVNNNGSYHVAVTDANGCENTDTIAVTINALPLVTVDLSSIDTVCNNSASLVNLVGETPIGGTWSGAGVVNGNQFDATLANSPAWNVIIYSFTDSVGCTASAADSIFVDVCSGLLDNGAVALEVTIYPNPNNGIFIIEGTTANDVIVVMNAVGQVVMNETANGSRTEINLSTQANGVYFVRVMHRAEMTTQRVMLSK